MALSLRNPRAEELARRASRKTGKNMTQVVVEALEEYLRRLNVHSGTSDLAEEIMEISKRCCSLPDEADSTWDADSEDPGVFA
jgi:antitoxin VapB